MAIRKQYYQVKVKILIGQYKINSEISPEEFFNLGFSIVDDLHQINNNDTI